MRIWLTVSATVLYARPFKQRDAVKLSEEEVPAIYRPLHENTIRHRDKAIAHRDPDADKKGVIGNRLPVVSDGNQIFIPITSPAMDDDMVAGLLDLVGMLVPMLEARSLSFVSKYLPQSLAKGRYLLSLEENPAEWLVPSAF